MTSCQICGRRRNVGKGGMILHHHARSQPCAGSGHPPIEQDDARLIEVLHLAAATDAACSRELAALYERRANYIDPALIERANRAITMRLRLQRRLDRHRAWPRRFARQMETQGWGSPPPTYLIERMDAQADL